MYELEDFLEDVLDAEFNTIADDGSLPEVNHFLLTNKLVN